MKAKQSFRLALALSALLVVILCAIMGIDFSLMWLSGESVVPFGFRVLITLVGAFLFIWALTHITENW